METVVSGSITPSGQTEFEKRLDEEIRKDSLIERAIIRGSLTFLWMTVLLGTAIVTWVVVPNHAPPDVTGIRPGLIRLLVRGNLALVYFEFAAFFIASFVIPLSATLFAGSFTMTITFRQSGWRTKWLAGRWFREADERSVFLALASSSFTRIHKLMIAIGFGTFLALLGLAIYGTTRLEADVLMMYLKLAALVGLLIDCALAAVSTTHMIHDRFKAQAPRVRYVLVKYIRWLALGICVYALILMMGAWLIVFSPFAVHRYVIRDRMAPATVNSIERELAWASEPSPPWATAGGTEAEAAAAWGREIIGEIDRIAHLYDERTEAEVVVLSSGGPLVLMGLVFILTFGVILPLFLLGKPIRAIAFTAATVIAFFADQLFEAVARAVAVVEYGPYSRWLTIILTTILVLTFALFSDAVTDSPKFNLEFGPCPHCGEQTDTAKPYCSSCGQLLDAPRAE